MKRSSHVCEVVDISHSKIIYYITRFFNQKRRQNEINVLSDWLLCSLMVLYGC